MFARKVLFSSIGRTAAMAAVAAMALTAVEPSPALAGSAPAGVTAKTGSSDATDFSARRRHGGGGAAAAAAFAGIVGTGIAIAASQNRRSYYDDSYGYYGGGPVYYGGGPTYYGDSYNANPYYGGTPYYGGGSYGYQYGHGYRNRFPTP